MRILIAEDSLAHRLTLQRAVEELGHESVSAEDGLRAWELYQADPFEILISDWVMPGIEGDELCRRVREAQDPYCYVIMLTTLDDKDHVLRAMRAGADDYLSKPLNPDELEARLAAASRVTEVHRDLAEQRGELERLNRELYREARHDPLTGAGNRLRLREDLDRLEGAIDRGGRGYAVAICDVDHFKEINDHSGHERGDEVLREVTDVLAATARRGDAVYRYGGDELIVVMPGCAPDQLGAAAERLRARIEALGLEHPTEEGGVVTASLGAAMRSAANGENAEHGLKRADTALYRAKRAGRNRVAVDGEL